MNDDDPDPRPDPNSPDWCMWVEETKCCGKQLCVMSYQTFRDGCLNSHALKLAIKSRSDMPVEQLEFTTNDYQKAAYREVVTWKYGSLGQSM